MYCTAAIAAQTREATNKAVARPFMASPELPDFRRLFAVLFLFHNVRLQGADDVQQLSLFLLRDLEFVERINEVLNNDIEIFLGNTKSSVSGLCRAADDLTGSAGHITDQILVLLHELPSGVGTHAHEETANFGIIEQLGGEVFDHG